MIWLLAFLTLPTLLLAITFKRALTSREPWLMAFAWVMDVVANYTLLGIVFPTFRWGEWTFSKRLPRLCLLPGKRGRLALWCKDFINKKVVGHIP